MTVLNATLLGILQGLTEFLPISSSGHLVLAQALIGTTAPGMSLEVTVHLGTLLSILYVFREDLWGLITGLDNRRTRNYILAIILGSLPAAVVGLGFQDWIESAFESILVVGVALIVTGVALILTKFIKQREQPLNIKSGFFIGCIQAVAIIPGISRSGSTISAAILGGIKPQEAARFSFLLAIPAITGAGLLTGLEIVSEGSGFQETGPLAAALTSSFVVGVLALKFLLGTLRSGKFYWFGVYCIGLGLATLFL